MKDTDLLILGIILGLITFYYLRKAWFRLRLNRKMGRARRAETAAVKVLKREGYRIIDMQKRVPIVTLVDGCPHDNWVQADFIVEKGGRRYVVEVKTGEQAPKVTSSATRRQLLEYFLIYRPDGILLLDMEYGKLREVNFQVKLPILEKISLPFSHYLISFCFGVVVVLLLVRGGWLG